MTDAFRVGIYIEDEFLELALCTTELFANRAKKILERNGWDDIEIIRVRHELNTLKVDGKMYILC